MAKKQELRLLLYSLFLFTLVAVSLISLLGINTLQSRAASGKGLTPALSPSPVGTISQVGTGNDPEDLVSDGTCTWVANNNSYTIARVCVDSNGNIFLNAVDNMNCQFPHGIAYDGQTLYVACYGSAVVLKINPANGATIASFPVDVHVYHVLFASGKVWMTNTDTAVLRAIDPGTGSTICTANIQAVYALMYYDGVSTIYVGDSSHNTIRKISTTNCSNKGAAISLKFTPRGVTLCGGNLFVTDPGGNGLVKINPQTGRLLARYSVGNYPVSVVCDGSTLWVANYSSNSILRVDQKGHTLQSIGLGSNQVAELFDSKAVWVSLPTTNQVARIQLL